MKMPASFAEFSDALQKARIKDGSFCKNELTCIHYNGLTHAMIGWNANLYDLNLFAQRLASLTEEQKKGMDALLKIKQNHRVAPIPLNQLINLTYNTDICCFAPRVSNHEELGAFLYANEMYLKDRADSEGRCWPAIRTIALELGLSRSTVKRALDDLCKTGLLQKYPRWRENGSLTSNLYHVV